VTITESSYRKSTITATPRCYVRYTCKLSVLLLEHRALIGERNDEEC